MGSCSAVLTQRYVRCQLTSMVSFARSVSDSDRQLLTVAMRLRCSTRALNAISVRNVFVVERNVMNAGTRPARDALTWDSRFEAGGVTFRWR